MAKDEEARKRLGEIEKRLDGDADSPKPKLEFQYCPSCKKMTLQMEVGWGGFKLVSEYSYEWQDEKWRCAACGNFITHQETKRVKHKIVKGDC
jgi:ribosomal protein L44E